MWETVLPALGIRKFPYMYVPQCAKVSLKLISQLDGVIFGMDFELWWTSHLQKKMSPFVSTASARTLASYPGKLFLATGLEWFYLGKVTNSIALVISSLMRLSANVTVITWKPCSWARLLNHLVFHIQQLSTKLQLFSTVQRTNSWELAWLTHLIETLTQYLSDNLLDKEREFLQ